MEDVLSSQKTVRIRQHQRRYRPKNFNSLIQETDVDDTFVFLSNSIVENVVSDRIIERFIQSCERIIRLGPVQKLRQELPALLSLSWIRRAKQGHRFLDDLGNCGQVDRAKAARCFWCEHAGRVRANLMEAAVAHLSFTPTDGKQTACWFWHLSERAQKSICAAVDVNARPMRAYDLPTQFPWSWQPKCKGVHPSSPT